MHIIVSFKCNPNRIHRRSPLYLTVCVVRVWSDGDAGKNPLPPYGSLGTHQCYSHLCLWPSFYITKLYFFSFYIKFLFFLFFMIQLLQNILSFFLEYIEKLRPYPLHFIPGFITRSIILFMMQLLQHFSENYIEYVFEK